jgi:hypothetical protein
MESSAAHKTQPKHGSTASCLQKYIKQSKLEYKGFAFKLLDASAQHLVPQERCTTVPQECTASMLRLYCSCCAPVLPTLGTPGGALKPLTPLAKTKEMLEYCNTVLQQRTADGGPVLPTFGTPGGALKPLTPLVNANTPELASMGIAARVMPGTSLWHHGSAWHSTARVAVGRRGVHDEDRLVRARAGPVTLFRHHDAHTCTCAAVTSLKLQQCDAGCMVYWRRL